ncbi:hypothetical protein GC173_00110 [bacterium]|nr:hypothetical protein [bacterium]
MTHILIFGVILPLLLSTFLVSGWWKAWAPASAPLPGRAVALPLVIACAWVVGALGILDGIRFPPRSAIERLVVGGGFAGLLVLIELARPQAAWLKGLVRTAVVALLVGWVTISRTAMWGHAIWLAAAVGAGLLAALVGLGIERFGERRGQWPVAFLLTGLLTCVAAVLGISGSAKLGQLTGILAAVVGPMIVLALIRRDFSLATSALSSFLAIGFGLVAAGGVSAEVPAVSIGLLAAAALIPWGGMALHAKPTKIEVPTVLVAAAVVALIGVAVAVKSSPSLFEESADPYSSGTGSADPNPY